MLDSSKADGTIDVFALRRCVLQCSFPNCQTNTRPVADAGPDQSATLGDTVTLNGTGSTDVDGDSLTFRWSLTAPEGSEAVLSDSTVARPTFEVDVIGEGAAYLARLIVNDGTADSQPDTVTIAENTAPVADAGPNQSAVLGDTVALNGMGSTDVDGDPLTYRWSLTVPQGSEAVLSDSTEASPTFVVDVSGEGVAYVAQLIVNDGTVDGQPDTVTISTGNLPPVANAGPNDTAEIEDTVTLDGSGSYDLDGDPLTYRWSLTKPPGSAAALSDPSVEMPTFVVDVAGAGVTYLAQLIVRDGNVDSLPDTVAISTENTAPVANAGPDDSATLGDTVTLDGTGSTDVDGDSLTYGWSLTKPAGSAAVLSNPTLPTVTFVADTRGSYIGQLIVRDGELYSEPDTVEIVASSLSEECRALLVGDACATPSGYGCVSVRYNDTYGGAGEADEIADILRSEGITFVGPSSGSPDSPLCVGWRPDLGGTPLGAECLLGLLPQGYRLEDKVDGPHCSADGFVHEIVAAPQPLSAPTNIFVTP
jgi:hypothetical protein